MFGRKAWVHVIDLSKTTIWFGYPTKTCEHFEFAARRRVRARGRGGIGRAGVYVLSVREKDLGPCNRHLGVLFAGRLATI